MFKVSEVKRSVTCPTCKGTIGPKELQVSFGRFYLHLQCLSINRALERCMFWSSPELSPAASQQLNDFIQSTFALSLFAIPFSDVVQLLVLEVRREMWIGPPSHFPLPLGIDCSKVLNSFEFCVYYFKFSSTLLSVENRRTCGLVQHYVQSLQISTPSTSNSVFNPYSHTE